MTFFSLIGFYYLIVMWGILWNLRKCKEGRKSKSGLQLVVLFETENLESQRCFEKESTIQEWRLFQNIFQKYNTQKC